jgi:hypothetical protein
MADKTTETKKQTRASGRERRRSLAAEPFEQLDEAARDSDSGRGSSGEAARTVKHALATAAAGALAAGLGGATKAWLDRRNASDSEEPEREEPSSDGAEQDDDARDETQAAATETAEEPVGEAAEAEDEGEPEPDAAGDQGAYESEKSEATPPGQTEAIVNKARDQLEQLLAREVESVSGFEREDGRWRVTLEVVEVQRIPESTDVLGSYEVVLDDDQNLVSFGQTRRYRRSQVEEA